MSPRKSKERFRAASVVAIQVGHQGTAPDVSPEPWSERAEYGDRMMGRTISNKGSPLEFFEFEVFVNICEWVSFRISDWPIHLLIHVWFIFGSWIQETPARARWSNRQLAPATQHQDESKWCHSHVQLVSFLKSWVLSVFSRSLFKTSTQHEAA